VKHFYFRQRDPSGGEREQINECINKAQDRETEKVKYSAIRGREAGWRVGWRG
jgi:hypothetical protein